MMGIFADQATGEAFQWLTLSGSIQVKMLEDAMRNYSQPVYEPADIGKHLTRALSAPMGGFSGDVSKVQMIVLAIAVIDYASTQGWNIVCEPGT